MRALLRSLAILVFLAFSAGIGIAQQAVTEEALAQWSALVTRVQDALENERVSDATLSTLRADVVAYRRGFDETRGVNAPRIALLRPGQRAETAFVLADGLIAQIDQTLRERQTQALFRLTATPLNPQTWQPAWRDLSQSASKLWTEQADRRATIGWRELRQNVAGVVLFGLLGVVLILRGRPWALRITRHMQSYGWRGINIWRFVVSLLRVVLPFLGLLALIYAARLTGYFGPRGDGVLAMIPALGAMLLGFRWLAERVFSREDEEALIPLSQEGRKQARFLVFFLTVMIAVNAVLSAVLQSDTPEEASGVVVGLIRFGAVWLGPLAGAVFRPG
jgi:hypothetical protein